MFTYVEYYKERPLHPAPEPLAVALGHVHRFFDTPLFKTWSLLTELLGKMALVLLLKCHLDWVMHF